MQLPGTCLPIAYMDKSLQAKSGIQASSSQGTTWETEGEGGDDGKEGGGKAPISSCSSPAQVSLFVCGFSPGLHMSIPRISSFREQGDSWTLQGKCWLVDLGHRTHWGIRAGPVRDWRQWEGECLGTSSYALASASS